MNETPSPFLPRAGFNGVAVRMADKRWILRQAHAHPTVEANLVLRGSGQIVLNQRRYPLRPGHLVWLWPGQWHVPLEWSSDMMLWVVEWSPAHLPRLRKARRRDQPAPADPDHPFCRRLSAPSLQRLDGLLGAVAAQPRADAFNRGLDFALFALWEDYLAAEPVTGCAALHPKLEAAVRILADPDDTPAQAELARRVGLSPYYLSALFRKQTGMAIPAYRNRLRLQAFFRHAQARPEIGLLRHALDAGFGSYAQFYRVFTAHTGSTPRQWSRGS